MASAPDSLILKLERRPRVKGCKLEPSLAGATPADRLQFERQGYFCTDAKDSKPGALVFNRTVALKDSWAKANEKGGRKK